MRVFYSILVQCAWHILGLIAYFNPKIKRFVEGRKTTFLKLENALDSSDRVIWMHVASLGEYEQGLPVIENLKKSYPNYKFLLTFFSPSGFEIKKDKSPADIVAYLPMDTISNSERFLELAKPELALFVKYEIWPNYLHELKSRQIPTLLISARFLKNQVYFSWYGTFMRKALSKIDHFFVQENQSLELLNSLGFYNVTTSGDTRFDRVHQILSSNNGLEFVKRFKANKSCLIGGSTWPEDEKILVDFINKSEYELKFILAPHDIKPAHIEKLAASITKSKVLYSQIEHVALEEIDVLIVDTIGLLTQIYGYGDYAYVGGGFATGLHNTLEPAVFGIPVIIGPKYEGFNEAVELVNKGGLLTVSNKVGFNAIMVRLLENSEFAKKTGDINYDYIKSKVGATETVTKFVQSLL